MQDEVVNLKVESLAWRKARLDLEVIGLVNANETSDLNQRRRQPPRVSEGEGEVATV